MCAVSPCPPPPPPLSATMTCPIPLPLSSGVLSPGCYNNDCTNWGAQKAFDGVESGIRSLAHTGFGASPSIQFNLGSVYTTLEAVRIVARSDCCLSRSQNMNVYLSTTTSFLTARRTLLQSTLVAAGVGASMLGGSFMVVIPDGMAGQYLTIVRNATYDALNLQEVVVLMTSECSGPQSAIV